MGKRIVVQPGDRYGRLTVLSLTRNEKPGQWVSARCDCGAVGDFMAAKLNAGHTRSCGCYSRDRARARLMKPGLIESGDRYGRLVVLSEVDPHVVESAGRVRRRRRLELRCDCGRRIVSRIDDLRSGDTTSCGCFRSEVCRDKVLTHGLCGHPAYPVWRSMITRCTQASPSAHRYRDRGVGVCLEWRDDPTEFCEWADRSGFAPDLQIDRVDNNLLGERSYSPENCRWVTREINMQNTCRSYWWHVAEQRYPSAVEAGEAAGISAAAVAARCHSNRHPKFRRERKYPDG